MRLSKRLTRPLIVAGVIAASLGGCWIADRVTPSNVRQALPATAADVQEYYKDDSFQSDFARCLQARISPSEMPAFAAKLGLVQRYNARRDSTLPLGFHMADAPSWWTPPATMDGAYFKYQAGKESFSVAKYQDGRVYFLATAW